MKLTKLNIQKFENNLCMELLKLSLLFLKIMLPINFILILNFNVCLYCSYLQGCLLQMLRENQNQGISQLTQLRDLCGVVSKSTAPKSIEILEKEVEDLESSLKEHLSRVGQYIKKANKKFKFQAQNSHVITICFKYQAK